MIPIIGELIAKGLGVLDKIIPDKTLRDKMKADYSMAMMREDFSVIQRTIDAQAKILTAEITGKSWLQRNWRPILMLTIVAIVANNYLVYPYLSLFTDQVVILELPDKLWNLMTIGVGGYIAGRSGEKMVEKWKK